MPGLGRFPCETCEYVASSRRMLARHVVLVHSEKVFKCPLCPFVTRYAANWYRHKRDLHGLTKETTCEVCGFFANSTEELAQHKESEHPEHLQLHRFHNKYAREKEKLGLESESVPDLKQTSDFTEVVPGAGNDKDNLDDLFFNENISVTDDSVRFSLPLNGGLLDHDSDLINSPPKADTDSKVSENMNSSEQDSTSQLRPLKVRRSYCCDACGLITTNPREFLYHRRDLHGERMSVHECKYCIYASKHIQKLQRHCNLVHRQQMLKDGGFPKKPKKVKAVKAVKAKKNEKKTLPPLQPSASSSSKPEDSSPYEFSINEPMSSPKQKQVAKTTSKILHCTACNYQTRNKLLLIHHEKTMHLKKKFYRCLQCGYVTNEKARYTKHIKYHNLPKVKCDFCHFKTAYKWNMDRHMKNHELGADGEFNCTQCSFITLSKQSLKMHVTKHHSQPMNDDDDDADEEEEEEMQEAEYEASVLEAAELEWENNAAQNEFDNTENATSVHSQEEIFEDGENSTVIWKQGKMYKKHLKCRYCEFRAAWPFEIKKHEEMHKALKKHPCPLCGMRFEHLAWLTKHLYRIHKENSQAREIADALQLLKPKKRRGPKDNQDISVEAVFQNTLKQSNIPDSSKHSMLSTLLKQSTVSPPLKSNISSAKRKKIPSSKISNAAKLSDRQMPSSGYSGTPAVKQAPFASPKPKVKTNGTLPACNICGYKTKWLSELQKHMRVHTDEKPFRCSKCDYHCKWKGDLTRHMFKFHGIKIPFTNKNYVVPKLKLKKALPNKHSSSSWQTVSQDSSNTSTSVPSRNSENKEQDSPLDLSVCKNSFILPNDEPCLLSDNENDTEVIDLSAENEELNDFESKEHDASHSIYKMEDLANVNSPFPSSNSNSNSDEFLNASAVEGLPGFGIIRKKYQCPFCSFNTRTASRFHVHIVQHYNKRPFMCSSCGYRSNWEWDITKHIRLKGFKDKTHTNACVLLTDETGRRNYNKYDKYLRDIEETKPSSPSSRNSDISNIDDNDLSNDMNVANVVKDQRTDSSSRKNDTYDAEQNSNVEGAPVSIVVTPDIDMSFTQESSEQQDGLPTIFHTQLNDTMQDSSEMLNFSSRFFHCKHCSYKHSAKKVVISHLAVHAGIRPFRCRVCGMTSNWRHVIVRHVKGVHNGYMNDVEDRITYIQEGYAIRLTSIKAGSRRIDVPAVNEAAQFGCKLCPYKCDKEFYIKFHMKQHKPREGAIYKCVYCPYFVKFKKTLIRHMKLHISNSPPSNSNSKSNSSNLACFMPNSEEYNIGNGRKSGNNSNLIADVEFMDSNIPLNFEIGNAVPIAFDQVQSEKPNFCEMGIKPKRHVCENCPYKTDNKTQYLYHKQFHRPNAAAPFKCSICSYWATMQHLLTQHMKVHRETTPDTFPSEKIAKQRKTAHSSHSKAQNLPIAEQIPSIYVQRGNFLNKMFKCRFCPMMNKKRANVRIHEKMHLTASSNDGKFACNLCNYKCLNQGGLTNHMKIHQANEGNDIMQEGPRIEETEISSESNSASVKDCDIFFARKKVFSYFCMRCPAVFKSLTDLHIHKTFHGSTLPFPCPHCDYRARHKPHLHKHLQVHTPAYAAKREASFGPPVNSGHENVSASLSEVHRAKGGLGNIKTLDQMLLLEASEVKAFLRKGKNSIHKMHKCMFCPAAFFKPSTLVYHINLHGSGGQFGCSQCNYSTMRSANLSIHAQVHSKVPVVRRSRVLCCPKCPAIFNKPDRFEKHLGLHGKKYRYVCDQCDYSVRFAANLFKHKTVHSNPPQVTAKTATSPVTNVDTNITTVFQNMALATTPSSVKSQKESLKSSDIVEEKKMFICDRCPYFQQRKDAVQSHQRRHWSSDGFKCPYCDYSSLQASFLRDHIRLHIQPTQLFPAQAFMKYETFEVWSTEDENRNILFEDKGVDKKQNERFYPALEIQDDTMKDENEKSSICEAVATNISEDSGFKASDSPQDDAVQQSNSRVSSPVPKTDLISAAIKQSKKLEVVLTDVFSQNKDLLKQATKNKIINRKLKTIQQTYLHDNSDTDEQDGNEISHAEKRVRDSDKVQEIAAEKQNKISVEEREMVSSAESDTKFKPSSIVMKIKVDNLEKKKERTTYSVIGKETERLLENASDSASDVTIPIDDFEEEFSPVIDQELSSANMGEVNYKNLDSLSDVVMLDEDCDMKQGKDIQNLLQPSVNNQNTSHESVADNLNWKADNVQGQDNAICDIMVDKVFGHHDVPLESSEQHVLIGGNSDIPPKDVNFMNESDPILNGCSSDSGALEHKPLIAEVEICL